MPGRISANICADPSVAIDGDTYEDLLARGFRRSGEYVYRPHCPSCRACVPIRIRPASFKPNRIQRRTMRRNTDLVVSSAGTIGSDEQFALYKKYLDSRHRGGGMDRPERADYPGFMISSCIETIFYEYRLASRLVAVSVVDRLQTSLSAVYTFFDPAERHRGLGTYALLWSVGEARRSGLDWLYLGYWIADSPKMSYKRKFRPHELFMEGIWRAEN